MPDMRRQPVTLYENLHMCNSQWDRTERMLWRCTINSCFTTCKRKAGLVKHRRTAHGLNQYEANIPDQRLPPKNDVDALRAAANIFAKPTDRKSLPASLVRNDLRSNGSRFEGGPTEFADCDLDTLYNMISYGLMNEFFDAHPLVGLELLFQALGRSQTAAQVAGPSIPSKRPPPASGNTRVKNSDTENSGPSKRTKRPPPASGFGQPPWR